jgi:murein DD-endopeptidase MepM/ murein hydrolase activator NlpD
VGAVFSKRTRVVGLSFCLVWVVYVTGQFRPLVHLIAADASARVPRATEPQYLPWTAGKTVRVGQGNGGAFSHRDSGNRYGWDFLLRWGEPVLSGVAGGVVFMFDGCLPIHSLKCNHGRGNTVLVRAADGTCARFGHLRTVAVLFGQVVGLGSLLGTVGSSGFSTGPHLHYQREDCESGLALPSSFVEAGVPLGGSDVTSALPARG